MKNGFGNASEKIFIESFGVVIEIKVSKPEAVAAIKQKLSEKLGDCFKYVEETETEHKFRYNWNKSGKDCFWHNGEKIFGGFTRDDVLDALDSKIRLTIAEFTPDKTFIHAGVVAWKDFAIVLPAYSNRGKTSLVAELVKRGAVYYSDEYAILDEDGFVHPFPKWLSVRGIVDKYKQIDIAPEQFGAKIGKKKIPVGMFLITEYKDNARWKPKVLTEGVGGMEILRHCISFRNKPEITLNVLNKTLKRAIIVKSFRGDVISSAEMILNFFETKVFSN